MLLSALGDHVQQVLSSRAQSPDGPRREEGTCNETRERLTLEADVTHMFSWGRVRGLGVCVDRKSSELQGDGDGTLFRDPTDMGAIAEWLLLSWWELGLPPGSLFPARVLSPHWHLAVKM